MPLPATFPAAGTVIIHIVGPRNTGKTTIGVLIAKALAKVFEDQNLIVPIQVVNPDGDWPLQMEEIDERLAEGLYVGGLKEVIISDTQPHHYIPRSDDSEERRRLLMATRPRLSAPRCTHVPTGNYVGPALPEPGATSREEY